MEASKHISDNINEAPIQIKGFKVKGIKIPFTTTPLLTKEVVKLDSIAASLPEDEECYLANGIPILVKYIATVLASKKNKVVYWLVKRQLYRLEAEELMALYNQCTALTSSTLFHLALIDLKKRQNIKISKEAIKLFSEQSRTAAKSCT